jgi:hypothetical protein
MSSGEKKLIGDPPTRKRPVRADQGTGSNPPGAPMMDPFTEQATHPAGDGQGANAPKEKRSSARKNNNNGDDEEIMPIEEGFSPVP